MSSKEIMNKVKYQVLHTSLGIKLEVLARNLSLKTKELKKMLKLKHYLKIKFKKKKNNGKKNVTPDGRIKRAEITEVIDFETGSFEAFTVTQTLLKDDEINANDYNISFKSEKAQGAGTLLVDVCDFKNFRLEYVKLAAAKRTMLILVTMKKKEKLVKRKKKESNSDDEEIICDESIPKGGNSNKIPKVSDISIIDQRIAKNVIELQKKTWCSIHNRYCLKDHEPHAEISNMMFLTWTTEMLNGLATVKDQHILHLDLINPIFSTLLQALVTPHFLQQPSSSLTSNNSIVSQSSQSIPSMAEFLRQIDEVEKTEDYYFNFLERFEKQRIRVKHLSKLNDTQFEICEVTAVGDIKTIREAAQKYK
ncbi:hypothetical protein RhiirC2_773901 [Rhizophagus irregularis]|uniref:Uncharacterized protein n=1 Tax=Rhizophagus irregularis TaxID=588596 RepID=A0A2N1NMW0_9GLOM|nr:hypothetical protein RhiirC2_773901 [Rhizophagus irregularis]